MQKIIHKQNDTLRQIIQKSVHLNWLNTKIQTLLTVDLAKHCQVANLKDGCLVIQVDNAIWCTYLEYQKVELLNKLHADHLTHITQIKFSVGLPIPQSKKDDELVLQDTISRETTELINSTADNVSDPALQNALRKLALHLADYMET